jgi:hypothetical protein
VNRKTYSKDDFYSDTQNYIRLKTPTVLLQNIITGKDDCPFAALEKSMNKLVLDPASSKRVYNYKYHLKMFCSIFKSAMRDEEEFIEKLDDKAEYSKFIQNILDKSDYIVEKFRALKDIVHVPSLDKKHFALFLFADEYLSLMLDKYRYRLLFFLKKCEMDEKENKKLRDDILKRLHNEIAYRESCKYPSVPTEHSDNEVLVYRMSTLKKIMGSILFLKTRTSREGRVLEQLSMGIGAGLAMAFATAIAFLCRWQFNDFTGALFISLVLAYIFKDRIKELTRLYIYKRVQTRIYDHKTTIMSSFNEKIGYCRENFSFISDKDLPEDIKRMRNKDYITELDNGYVGEDVIFSKKQIKILSNRCRDLFKDFKVDGINDILRFNIRHFLDKMDNPEKNLFVPGEDDIKKVKGSRVYHLNLAFKYKMGSSGDIFKRFRIILNRDGIKRIHEIKTAL